MNKGFTLSEVLITLVVLGVISAIAIPTLQASWQKTKTISALKKAYSALSRTTYRAIADNGPIATWEAEGLTAAQFSEIYLKPYLLVMNTPKSIRSFDYQSLNKEHSYSLTSAYDIFYLTDGSKIGVGKPSHGTYGISSKIFIDINGDGAPNTLGRDVFVYIYWMLKYGTESSIDFKHSGVFIPYGGNWTRKNIINTSQPYGCRKDKTGELCAALIMVDGWQMKGDYPW